MCNAMLPRQAVLDDLFVARGVWDNALCSAIAQVEYIPERHPPPTLITIGPSRLSGHVNESI